MSLFLKKALAKRRHCKLQFPRLYLPPATAAMDRLQIVRGRSEKVSRSRGLSKSHSEAVPGGPSYS